MKEMKNIFQKNIKLKTIGIVFFINNLNYNNMLYIVKLLQSKNKYKRSDYIALLSKDTNLEVDDIFDLTIKSNQSDYIGSLKDFISQTQYKKLFIINNNIIYKKDENSKYIEISFPSDITKLKNTFDFYNKDIIYTTLSQKKSMLKSYELIRNNYIFLTIGKDDSKGRQRVINGLDRVDKFQDFVLLMKRNIFPFDNIKHENITDEDLNTIYKKIKKKNISLTNLKNGIDGKIYIESESPIDKYGKRLSTTKKYGNIHIKINDNISKFKEKLKNKKSKSKSKTK